MQAGLRDKRITLEMVAGCYNWPRSKEQQKDRAGTGKKKRWRNAKSQAPKAKRQAAARKLFV